jgi:hypothetical protein
MSRLGHAMAPGQPGEARPMRVVATALLAGREGYAARQPLCRRGHSPGVAPFASASASIFARRV